MVDNEDDTGAARVAQHSIEAVHYDDVVDYTKRMMKQNPALASFFTEQPADSTGTPQRPGSRMTGLILGFANVTPTGGGT